MGEAVCVRQRERERKREREREKELCRSYAYKGKQQSLKIWSDASLNMTERKEKG